MRAIRVASAVLLGVTALSLTAPAAHAAPAGDTTSFGFSVVPSTVAPGGEVTLRVDGCHSRTTVSSAVFDTVTIPKGQSSAKATVDWDARHGAVYEVSFQCGNESGQTDLTIASGRPSHHPSRGSHAGTGGTVAGLDPGEIGLGAALVAGTLGVAWRWSRRRAEDGSHT
ncbi:hypothetical protein [Streptomyces heilongjiangensis]|uniref:Lipoprotein n=1 Tax=Streptomyces heilongjiangensis TaxID=945052 RepID=A0ABW1BDD0_9ACTN|nr:hypothetical protein [Streptomyces heilongjiangensis]MDC2948847.1 hypothetical protein [Streptomyces heilongjiangensis]